MIKGNPSILCVDDEKSVLNSIKRLLRKQYHVMMAQSAKDGLEQFQKFKDDIHVVISDLKMPEINGIDFLKEITKLKPESVNIILSGTGDFSHTVEAINQNLIYKYLLKPWKDSELIQTIDDAYKISRENQMMNQVKHLIEHNQNNKLIDMTPDNIERINKLSKVGLMTSKILHDINNEAFALTTGLHLISDMNEELNLPDNILQMLNRSVKSVTEMIDDVQTYIKNQHLSPKIETINLGQFISSLKPDIKSLFMHKSISLKLNIDDSIELDLDPEKFKRVIKNLAKNSTEAMEEGHLIIHAFHESSHIEIHLSDNGPGIAQSVKNNLFKPYASTKVKGIGIGLMNVKEIIEMHKGTISVQSEEGVGTTFIIKLPHL